MADIVLESPAPPAQVLAVIAESGREWRESVIPPELRRERRYRVRVRVTGDRFRLELPSHAEAEHQAEIDVVLHGAVYSAPGGGSIVRASFGSRSPGFWLAVAAIGFVVLFWSLTWGLLLLAGGLASMAHDHWRMTRLRSEGTALTRYLAERLRAAIPAATSPESPADAGR